MALSVNNVRDLKRFGDAKITHARMVPKKDILPKNSNAQCSWKACRAHDGTRFLIVKTRLDRVFRVFARRYKAKRLALLFGKGLIN